MRVVCGVGVLVGIVLGACGEPTWPSRVRLGVGMHPQLAVADDGSAVAAWFDGSIVRARHRDSSGAWGEPVTIGNLERDTLIAPGDVALAIGRGGHALVAFHTELVTDTAGSRGNVTLHAARFDPGAGWRPTTPAVELIDEAFGGGWHYRVRMVVDTLGTATVAIAPRYPWSSGTVRVVRQAVDAAWQPIVEMQPEASATSRIGFAPDSDDVVLTWQQSGWGRHSYVTRYSGGAWTAPEGFGGVGAWVEALAGGGDRPLWMKWSDGSVSRYRETGWDMPTSVVHDAQLHLAASAEHAFAVSRVYRSPENLAARGHVFDGTQWGASELLARDADGVAIAATVTGHAIALVRSTAGIDGYRVDGSVWQHEAVHRGASGKTVAVGVASDGTAIAVWDEITCTDDACTSEIVAVAAPPP